MRSSRPFWLLACALLIGCASSEGGVTGTGVSAISGNVVVVSAQAAQESDALPFPIRVTVEEFPQIAATTDADGAFELTGAFSGALTLRFADAADGTLLGPLRLEVPAGSQTVLENIDIRLADPLPDRVRPRAVRQFDVFGRTDLIECNADGSGTLLITDVGRPPRQFMIALTVDTSIADDGDESLTCADIGTGVAVRVSAFLRHDDQTLVAVSIAVAASRPPQPGPNPRPERLHGVVQAVACGRGIIEVAQGGLPDAVQRVVRLTDATVLECPPALPGPCDCGAIAVGQPIAVDGAILPQRPGQVQADLVILGVTSVPVDLTGTITRLGCAVGGLGVRDIATRRDVRVALTDATSFRCADLPCRCADLRVRDRVRVEGRRPPNGGPVTADRITALRQPGPAPDPARQPGHCRGAS